MSLPNQVKVGGFNSNIREVEGLIVDYNHLGEFSPRTNEITIDSSLVLQQKQEVLLHEIIEAIVNKYQINIEHKDLSIMSVALYQIIKDNPDVIAYLMEV